MSRISRAAVFQLVLLAGVCAHADGFPESPRGEILAASFGLCDMQVATGGALPTVHARLTLRNAVGGETWFLDARQVFVEIPREGRSPAVYVNADVGGLPRVYVGAGEERIVDFYFPLPGWARDDGLATFDLSWRIVTGGVTARSGRARFRRPADETGPSLASPAPGGGAFWWYDPFYPRVGVYRHEEPFLAIPLAPHEVRVVRRGRAAYQARR